MERRRFDDLARFAARHTSRRAALKLLGGTAATAVGGALVIIDRSRGQERSRASSLPAATPVAQETLPPSTGVTPSLELTPAEAASGGNVDATLAHFTPGVTVEIRVLDASDSTTAPSVVGDVVIPEGGGGFLTFTIPATSPHGPSIVEAAGQTAGQLASATLFVSCSSELTTCGDLCADLQTDPRACGACGNSCGAGEICLDGGCIAHQIPAIRAYFAKYDGVCVDFDGEYGDQCMDLAEYYNRDVVGAPQIGGDAIDAWTYYSDRFYLQIENGPGDVPELGDLVIWSGDYGNGAGHIAVCHDADLTSFTSFDQNWPSDSCCHFQFHESYQGVIGWLRPKW
jgi:CHAP domain/Stigma-specific protein, Stig1